MALTMDAREFCAGARDYRAILRNAYVLAVNGWQNPPVGASDSIDIKTAVGRHHICLRAAVDSNRRS